MSARDIGLVLALLGWPFACASSVEPTAEGRTSSTPTDADTPKTMELHPKLAETIAAIEGDITSIPAERRESLDALADFIVAKRSAGEPARLTFICTHNSRRSHMSQLWAAVAAAHFGITGVETFSGGTESTAFNPRAVAALQRAGFEISAAQPEAENPRYQVSYSPRGPTLEAFSKTYDEAPNPSEGFAAVMTCSQADQSCPFVKGAELRVAVPYVDPKESDGTPEEAATYDARSRQIAVEMLYVFSRVAVPQRRSDE